MCMYCDYKETNDYEKDNQGAELISVDDGSHTYQVLMFRYESEDDVDKSLTLHVKVDGVDGNGFTVINKILPIKYCPFCGKEL